MNLKDLEEFSKKITGKLLFDYNLNKSNWFNIGGKTKIYFKPESLTDLVDFLKLFNKRGRIFVLGAGSNVLFEDSCFDGVVIKLGKNFSKLSILNDEIVIAGKSTDKNFQNLRTKIVLADLNFFLAYQEQLEAALE